MKIHLRIDDYPFGMPEDKAKYSFDDEASKLDVLDWNGIQVMLACVPKYIYRKEMLYIKSHGNITPCLHGFSHGMKRWRPLSDCGGEFHTMNFDTLKKEYDKYGVVIDSLNSYIMVPPFNAFTQVALDFFKGLGIEYVTGGPESRQFGFDKLNFHGMRYVEATHYCSCSIVTSILRSGNFNEFDTFCIHLPWEKRDDIVTMAETMRKLNLEVVPYERTCITRSNKNASL